MALPTLLDLAYGTFEIDHAPKIGNTTAPSRAFTARTMGNTILLAALYGAFAVIGAIIFGTLSVHPF